MNSLPLVTCMMPTADRRLFVAQAVAYFLVQDYPQKELLIVDDGVDSVADLAPENAAVRYFRLEKPQSVGAKRNIAAQQAGGEILVHWDDDDWSAPRRLSYQVEQLRVAQADICGLDRIWFYAPDEQRAWEYVYPRGERPWVYGASLAYTRVFWEKHRFPEINVGEDARFVWADARAKIHVLSDSRFLVARIHAANTSRKRTSDPRYQARPVEEIKRLLGDDFSFSHNLKDRSSVPVGPPTASKPKPRALISAALGIGDILRVTPLIRVAHRLGYETDVLLATDYPDVIELLEGAPEIRHLFHLPSPRRGAGPTQVEGLSNQIYDVATFTTWSAPLQDRVQARSVHLFDRRRWLAEGDTHCVERIARDLGWQGELPEPFAMASSRKFNLPAGTIAIHPGCKYEWPWKKWHGFDELARRFSNVVIVGTEEDLRTDNTYFQRAFAWPEHARIFTGKLDLRDTAALVRACAALVSNDSGLMHLGVVLGVPTFGIFGITSPQRETICAPNMFPITKGLPCEPACRKAAWGRRDCDHHLRCLKTLTPEEVFMKITATLSERNEKSLPAVTGSATPQLNGHSDASEKINLAYYGYVFDASGYGHAARAYLHALHLAGVELNVVDLAAHRPRQVEDPLVASLLGRPLDADFHLFHGTPPQWARLAFPLRNVIAMTVWETDTMPTQWRPVLTHALDVWLPCEFNVAVFSAALGKPVFKLPHPVFSPEANNGAARDAIEEWEIQTGDFVFYAIFEWQDRKSPERTLEAYFRSFPEDEKTVLVLKTNPGATTVASRAIEEVRGRTGSRARAAVRAEAWSEAQVAALHARGDCYVSLHQGEGWGYPLFEAASRGKPVIATGYSGPLDYLAADAHGLVRHTLTAVRQPYAYYRPSMQWAEPDTAHASELMRAIRAQPDAARARAAAAAKVLARDYSLEAIGQRAQRRLTELLRRTDNAKWERLNRAQRETHLRPPVPIPGDWFDADYFEHGIKSNWESGYHWRDFASLFRETAQFLVAMFPEAASFLDAGCAKGFLVRALRELGKDAWGFDHSAWALERAEELAHPFLQLADTASVDFGRPFNILLAFSLFESLTETQAEEFLQRARTWTRDALVAVVLVCESEEPKSAPAITDRDLSHITSRSRNWWHDLLLKTGWKQDALHRTLQRLCQENPLPARMGWQLFVYAPT
jgi:glycosyltransferase involved in cell wall biosynthesis